MMVWRIDFSYFFGESFTNDWKKVEEIVILIAKLQHVRTRGIVTQADMDPLMAPKTLAAAPSTSKINKVIPDDILEDLIKDFKKLKVELTTLKKDQRSNTSRSVERSKGYVVMYIQCDDPNHKRSDCGLYAEALKKGIVIFRKGRIKDTITNESLGTNFGRGSMKKLEEKLGKTNFIQAKKTNIYYIEASQSGVEASSNTSREVLIREAQAISELIGWANSVDISTIKDYLIGDHNVDMFIDASMEGKRDKITEDEEAEEPVSKKKPPNGRGAASSGESPPNRNRQKEETRSSLFHPRSVPLPKEKQEEKMAKKKEKEKKGTPKEKEKTPTYKLQTNIESSIDLKGILKREFWMQRLSSP